jgi:hypothetical protein
MHSTMSCTKSSWCSMLAKTKPLSPHEISQVFRYEPETGCLFWRISPHPKIPVGAEVTGKTSTGYGRVKYKGCHYSVSHIAWAIETGEWPTLTIDHRDRAQHNNRFCNLREANDSTQQINRVLKNESGFKGVRRQKNRFRAEIRRDGKATHIGSFLTAIEAAIAFDDEAIRVHGSSYPTNRSLGLI